MFDLGLETGRDFGLGLGLGLALLWLGSELRVRRNRLTSNSRRLKSGFELAKSYLSLRPKAESSIVYELGSYANPIVVQKRS